MSPRVIGKILLVIYTTLLIQWTIGLDIRVGGNHPDLILLLPIVTGIAAGPQVGSIVGFVAGFGADLFLPTPMGLSALVLGIVGFFVGLSMGSVTRALRWYPVVVAAAASAAGVITYALLGAVLGQAQFVNVDLSLIVAVVAVGNAALVLPGVRLARWMLRPPVGAARW